MNTVSIIPSGSWNPRDFFNLFPQKEKDESITLHENRDTYLIVAVFPGFIKDEIQIRFQNGVVNIYAASYLASRSTSSRFCAKRNIHRTVAVRGDIDEGQIRYLYERNILKIWLPKKAHKSRPFGVIGRFDLLRRFRKKA